MTWLTLDLMLSVILILFYAYVYVWSRGPRDGKLSKRIRGLEHEVGRLRKRARKKQLVFITLLALFLIPTLNPCPNYVPAAIVTEPQSTKDFILSADGDESSESITSFGSTLPGDTLFFPDTFHNDTIVLASSGTAGPSETWDYTHTHDFEEEANRWYYGSGNPDGWTIINFTVPTGDYTIDGFDYAINCVLPEDDDSGDFLIYDWTVDDWVDFGDVTIGGFGTWHNGTIYDPDHWDTQISLKVNSTDAGGSALACIDYAEVTFYVMHLADSDHYAESFADVSDWTAFGIEASDGYSSDSDLLSIEAANSGSNDDNDGCYDDSMSLSGTLYAEIRYRINHTSIDRVYLGLTTGDAAGGTWHTITLSKSTSWTTTKTLVTIATVESAIAFVRTDIGQNDVLLEVDYLRIGPADEMGWAHDGSTTAGVTDGGGGSSSSDGDELTLTADADGSSFEFAIDTTATAAYLDADYYPMVSLDFNDADSGDYIKVESYDGSAWATVIANTTVGTDTHYANCRAADADIEKFRISVNPSANPRLKWFKAFSIANFSITEINDESTNTVLYVDGGALKLSGTVSDVVSVWQEGGLISVTTPYNVWNMTTPDATNLRFHVDTSSWTTYDQGESRGEMPSGTVDRVLIKIYDEATISAIKFIEDGTAPVVVRSSSTPNDPEDDEAITLSAVITDAVEVYAVAFNAIVYPTGFSDVDYDATEQADNLWTYEFSSLITGYYCFKIVATDGANENALTEYAYIEITVREAQIRITTYTFFGASSDFSYMQYSGHISHDCTYNISEWSTTWPENETHTGSVTEGMFNIAWDKIGVDDAEANFTIVFVSGTLSLTIEGYYGTAYKEMRITEIDFINLEQSDNWATNLTINFYTNKEVDWTVYDVDNDDAVLHSGTTTEGDGFITWVKNNARGAHHFAVKWTDGISDQWYNNSYWIYERNIDDLPGGADPGADQRRTIEFWATVAGIAGVLGIVVIGLSHYNMDEKIKNLPNYRTQERGRR